jgi:hypothetical protein
VVLCIASDHPDLTALLMPHVPRSVGIVFKLASEADLSPVQRTCRRAPDGVRIVLRPVRSKPMSAFAEQGHDRSWIEPLLHDGQSRLPDLLQQVDDMAAARLELGS